MKTFFTLCAALFLAIVIAIFFAGYVSKSNREVREAYEATVKSEMVAMTATIDQATAEIERLKAENAALTAQVASSNTPETKPTTSTKPTTQTKPVTTTKPTTPVVVTPAKKTITTALVATHKTASDCWIIVSGKAYSVSSYMKLHPGGQSIIVTQCGKDATAVFTNRGGTGKHSDSAWSMLDGFLVGALGSVL